MSQPHVADSGFYENLNLNDKFKPVGKRHLEIVSDPQIKVFRDVLFEFHLKFWNTASIVIPVRSLL